MPIGPKRTIDAKSLPDFAKRVRELRGRRNMADFAQCLGVSAMAVSHWESGKIEPGGLHYLRMARDAGNGADFFLRSAALRFGMEGDDLALMASALGNRSQHGTKSFVEVKLLCVTAAAGPGHFQETEEVEGVMALPGDVVPHPIETRCIRVLGESMSPTIGSKSIVAVDGAQRRAEKLVGEIVVARHTVEGNVMKRLAKDDSGYWLRSDNTSYRDIDFQKDWEIVGRVIWWIQTA